MTATQPHLPAIDWTDLCDVAAALHEDEPDPRHRDLRGQGLTALEIHTMTDVPLRGSYL